MKEQMEREDKLRQQMSKDISKSKLQKDRGGKQTEGGASRMNSRMGSSRQSLRESRDSQYNFKRQESGADEDTKSVASHASRQSKVSKQSKKSIASKGSLKSSSVGVNESQNQSQSKQSTNQNQSMNKSAPNVQSLTGAKKTQKRGPPSGLSDLAKKEFAEDSREDAESSDQCEDEDQKAKKWRESTYYYKCPVFRVSQPASLWLGIMLAKSVTAV